MKEGFALPSQVPEIKAQALFLSCCEAKYLLDDIWPGMVLRLMS